MSYCSVISTPERFANCLSHFQLHDLLMLKKSMEQMSLKGNHFKENIKDCESCDHPTTAPHRMALMAADRSTERGTSGSSIPSTWQTNPSASWVEEKPSKLQTLFQISITTLAFLSFGGYLLCLIVQAIKSKGTTYFHPVATAMTTSTNGNVKRIKIYRRSKRNHDDLISNLLAVDYATYMKVLRGQSNEYSHLVGS